MIIRALIKLCKTEAQNVMYGVLATLVNITISYDKQEINHEMLKLVNFVKHHILEDHWLDEEDFVENLEYCPECQEVASVTPTENLDKKDLLSELSRGTCWGFSVTTTRASTHLPPAYRKDSSWTARADP